MGRWQLPPTQNAPLPCKLPAVVDLWGETGVPLLWPCFYIHTRVHVHVCAHTHTHLFPSKELTPTYGLEGLSQGISKDRGDWPLLESQDSVLSQHLEDLAQCLTLCKNRSEELNRQRISAFSTVGTHGRKYVIWSLA